MKKSELRKIYKAKRMQLDKNEVAMRSKILLKKFKQLDFSTKKYFHIFLPIEPLKEVNTWLLIDYLHKIDKKVVVSITDFEAHKMLHYEIDEKTKFKLNSLKIPEPIAGNLIDISKLEVVLVPLLVADKQLDRVGYGKGFYDEFLKQCNKETLFIGLSFFPLIDKISDANADDVPLHQILISE